MKNLTRDAFLATVGGVYEHSAWIAEMAFDKDKHLSAQKPSDLAGAMAKIVETAPQELQMALLRAHPDLAGKLAQSAALSDERSSEQASTGLEQCAEKEHAAFTVLNAQYREKFGFPFILAIRDRNRREILENLRKRMNSKRCARAVGFQLDAALNAHGMRSSIWLVG